jgi:transposase
MGLKRTDEFRQDAVRIALTSGLTRKQVADDLGVGMSTLNKWITAHRDTDVVSKEDLGLAQENDRLRRENRILKEEKQQALAMFQFHAGKNHGTSTKESGLTSAIEFAENRYLTLRGNLNLSQFDAAPLIAFISTKETNYGTETARRISPRCGALAR